MKAIRSSQNKETLLSILIPVYNYPVGRLVSELKDQCLLLGIEWEIIAEEDGSQLYLNENSELASMSGIVYRVNSENIGRSKIRNQLAAGARYAHYLFLDCDSQLVSPSFIANYIALLEKPVVYGGRVYPDISDPQYALHRNFGIYREAPPAAERMTNPYQRFLTNNFLIQKNIFDVIRFDESLTQYGFEDNLFAWELKKHNIPIYHIENPVLHEGLDDAQAFLNKTYEAIENAWSLIHSGKIPASEIRFAHMYNKLRPWYLQRPIAAILQAFEPVFIANLKGARPRLVFLDFLKLLWSYRIRLGSNHLKSRR